MALRPERRRELRRRHTVAVVRVRVRAGEQQEMRAAACAAAGSEVEQRRAGGRSGARIWACASMEELQQNLRAPVVYGVMRRCPAVVILTQKHNVDWVSLDASLIHSRPILANEYQKTLSWTSIAFS